MLISKKSRYALRSVLELAKRKGAGPVKISEIAATQFIPRKFLEAILVQLKQAGFVESIRGSDGGYMLTREPETLTVGDIIRIVQGLPDPVECLSENPSDNCPLRVNCVFVPMWEEMRKAITNIYDSTTFQDLVTRDKEMNGHSACDYAI